MSLHTIEFAIANGLSFKVSNNFDFINVEEFRDNTVLVRCKHPNQLFSDVIEFSRDMLVEVVWIEDAAAKLTKTQFDTMNAVRDTLIAEYIALDDTLYSMSAIYSINTATQAANRLNSLREQISQLTDILYA